MPVQISLPGTLDHLVIPDNLLARYKARGWVRVIPEPTEPAPAPAVEPLRGKALATALKDAGLSLSGTVAEKLARLAACSITPLEEQS